METGDKSSVILVVKGPVYYAPGDEDAFYRWLETIPSTLSIGGQIRDIHIAFSSQKLSRDDLREILAIFFRYRLKMTGLAMFLTPSNAKWFRDPKMYWHKKVFGMSPVKNVKRHSREGWDEASKGLMDEDINAIDDAWAQ